MNVSRKYSNIKDKKKHKYSNEEILYESENWQASNSPKNLIVI